MSAKITIYQKPTCSTCREVHRIMKEAGVDFESVDYYINPIPQSKLKELLKKMGMKAQELLRPKESIYKELNLGEQKLSEEKIIELMVKYPDLIQRPIVEKGGKAILARPADKVKAIL